MSGDSWQLVPDVAERLGKIGTRDDCPRVGIPKQRCEGPSSQEGTEWHDYGAHLCYGPVRFEQVETIRQDRRDFVPFLHVQTAKSVGKPVDSNVEFAEIQPASLQKLRRCAPDDGGHGLGRSEPIFILLSHR